MVRADMMSEEQIARLVEVARRDQVLWEDLKDREINQFHDDGSPKLPSLSMLVSDLVKRECGTSHNFELGSLIVRLRYHVRKELGLPV